MSAISFRFLDEKE
jgi:predicted transcriptional regulator